MDRPTQIVVGGMVAGFLIFCMFLLLSSMNIPIVNIALNKFLQMIGLIIFFISGFFFVSMRTIKK